jgi:broad specificity phosphatase PhoE/GNAT superfamily N-acetyltransferase
VIELLFETHSISIDNEVGIATGWGDGALSPRGKRLAVELGKRHRDVPPAVVFTSDLGRAVETAEIAFGETGIPIQRDARLRECDYGALTGMPVGRLDAERPNRVDTPFPGGESYQQVTERVEAWLSELSVDRRDRRVVVIGHSATKWALDYLVKGVPLETSVAAPFGWQEGWLYTIPRPGAVGRIRSGGAEDRGFLELMLRESAFPDDPSMSVADVMTRPDLAMTIPDFSRLGDIAMIAEEDGTAVGACWCRCFTDREHSWGYLSDATPELGIAVDKTYRGRGVGTALLGALIEAARAEGWGSLSLCTTRGRGIDHALYSRAGFATVRCLEDSPDAVVMRLDLAMV